MVGPPGEKPNCADSHGNTLSCVLRLKPGLRPMPKALHLTLSRIHLSRNPANSQVSTKRAAHPIGTSRRLKRAKGHFFVETS